MSISRLLPLLVLALPQASWAFTHTGRMWLAEDFPLKYWVADDGTEASTCEETVDQPGYCADMIQQGYGNWEAVGCAEIHADYMGVCENNGHNSGNLQNWITFNDPNEEIEESGTWAVTYTVGQGIAKIIDGVVFTHATDSDIVFNDANIFDSHEDIVNGACNGGADILAVATHEIGHTLGLDHSCQEGDPCADPVLREATMYWAAGTCDITGADINEDDIQGITALYGPYATFSCSHALSEDLSLGIVPFELKCVIESESIDEVDKATWRWGDGAVSESLNATHVYEKAGNYNVQVEVHGNREVCGEDGWTFEYRKVGYVTACDLPIPDFTIVQSEGRSYQLINDSDVSVYGCLQDISWVIHEGDSVNGPVVGEPLKAWEPLIEVPEYGTYTVVLNLGGFAGTTAAKLTFDAKPKGISCSTGPEGSAAGLGLAAIGLLFAGRRRSTRR